MMHECSLRELLARAAFMHDDDQGHATLKHYPTFKGLMMNAAPTKERWRPDGGRRTAHVAGGGNPHSPAQCHSSSCILSEFQLNVLEVGPAD